MRKGAWLNRPVIMNERPATNKYDVDVARANALAPALDQIRCSSIGSSYRDSRISDLIRALTKE